MKGIGFMAVSSGLFFAFSLSVFRRMERNATQLVRSQQRLVQAERDAIAGLITSSVAHDFANLLTILRLSAEKLGGMSDLPVNARENLSKLDHVVSRLAELAQRMRTAGQNVLKSKPSYYDLHETIEKTLEFLCLHKMVSGCKIEIRSSGGRSACGYPILIHQLLMNLVLNAAEATEGKGHILILVGREGPTLVIEVHDNGPGISPLLRENIFEAFFTTKKFGTGLGLMSVKSCVDVHGGAVEIGDSHLGGASFVVRLPDLQEVPRNSSKLPEMLNKNSSFTGSPAMH